MWLLIGSFAATRKVLIFTDDSKSFNDHLNIINGIGNKRVSLYSTADAFNLDIEQTLSPWSTFRNKEAVSDFEASQLNLILKKFVK